MNHHVHHRWHRKPTMSTKPPPAFALHKTPIMWEQRWQKYLDDLYVKHPNLKSLKKLFLLESPPDSVIRQAFKSNHSVLCQLQRRIFNFAAERCTEDDFDRKWRAAGPKAQEECFFHAMKRIAVIGAMEFQRKCVKKCSTPAAPWVDVLHRFAPEITLRNFRVNDGWGYLNLLRSLLPDRLVVNEYIRIPHPVFDAALGFTAPFDTGDSMPAERDRLMHKVYMLIFELAAFFVLTSVPFFRVDMVRCTFMSMVVWYTLCSFYNASGDFPLFSMEEPAQNGSSDSTQETNKEKPVPKQVKSLCANCKKRASDFPNITFKSCAKCKDTPSSVMYCSR
jgi:hypothetical protein